MSNTSRPEHTSLLPQCQSVPAGPEESKVRPKKRIISPGDLKKERRKPGCAFLALDFQRTRPSSIRRRLTASLILEFHRRELGRGSPSRRCHHWLRRSRASVRLAAAPLSIRDKSKVPETQESGSPPPPSRRFPWLAAVEFPQNLRHRPACRQAPLNGFLQALPL